MILNKNKGKFAWYVLYTHSGHEHKVSELIKQRADNAGLGELIQEIVTPTRNVTQIKNGKKKDATEKILPGYILIHMVLGEDTWAIVRDTPGVTSFVGTEKKPSAVTDLQADAIIKFSKLQQPVLKTNITPGDTVKVKNGNFKEYTGIIDTINEEKGKVTVKLHFLGREVPVTLDILEIEKI
ncbi:MAG: transcription termination/antitermination protein NusG [bacterium]